MTEQQEPKQPKQPKQNPMTELVEGILRGAENNPVTDGMRTMAEMMRASYAKVDEEKV